MTQNDLLDVLVEFIKKTTKDILLPVRVDRKSGERRERPAEVHKMQLPDKNARTERIPYILVQFIKSVDDQEPGQHPVCKCLVRIVVATYSEDEHEGTMCVLNVLSRIRIALLKDGIIGDCFLLKPPIESIIYPDNVAPYYLGEMMTTWEIPIIESEVQITWQ